MYGCVSTRVPSIHGGQRNVWDPTKLELQLTARYHVDTGKWTWLICKYIKCLKLLSCLSSPYVRFWGVWSSLFLYELMEFLFWFQILNHNIPFYLLIENLLSGTFKRSDITEIFISPKFCMMFFINSKIGSIEEQEKEEFTGFVDIPYMHKHTQYMMISWSNLESLQGNAQLIGLFLHKYFKPFIEY